MHALLAGVMVDPDKLYLALKVRPRPVQDAN
jgi:hypothetical protein